MKTKLRILEIIKIRKELFKNLHPSCKENTIAQSEFTLLVHIFQALRSLPSQL